jgi:hypothetical protein
VAGQIDLGTAVRVSLSGSHRTSLMCEEGVVIEVVEPATDVRAARVFHHPERLSVERRYVVQCWSRRVLRHAAHMVVVSP